MKKWLRRIRDSVAMGLTWATVWAVLSVLIGTITEFLSGYPVETVVDNFMALAMPGFLGGVIFSTVLWFTEGGRRFDELSLPRLAAWGAVVGLLLGALAFALGTPKSPVWLTVIVLITSSTVLSTVSAVGSAPLFRYTVRHKIPVHAGLED